MIMKMEQQQALAAKTREMRPIMDLTGNENPAIFAKSIPFNPWPSMRYNHALKQMRIINGVEEEHKDWIKKPWPNYGQEVSAATASSMAEVEQLEDENERLQRRIQELEAMTETKRSK